MLRNRAGRKGPITGDVARNQAGNGTGGVKTLTGGLVNKDSTVISSGSVEWTAGDEVEWTPGDVVEWI